VMMIITKNHNNNII